MLKKTKFILSLRMMYQNLKKKLKKILPDFLWKKLKQLKEIIISVFFIFKIQQLQYRHSKALKKIIKKKKIKVAFLLVHNSVWKYEGVYRLMDQDERFDPVVIVCPYIIGGEGNMHREMDQAFDAFNKEGYNVIKSLKKTGEWLDIKKEVCPDMVCFTNPWNLTRPEYLITNFMDTLTCYVPYGFKNSNLFEAHFNKPMQNFTWKFFLETEIHQKLSRKYSKNKGINTIVTGYPGMDKFLQKDYKPIDEWKIKDKKIKRIIWAPHHTIPGMGATLDYSTFLDYSEFMLELAEKYVDEVQIAFKPHPVLRPNLSNNEVWGKEKTDQYYQKWAQLSNGLLQEGKYIDLFLTSDGMIHDSSSFVIEYLYTNKPVMFLVNNDSIPEKFNEIGKMAFSNLYHGKNQEEIEEFVKNIIINGSDYKRNERISFFNSTVKPPNNKTASENIFYDIKVSLSNTKVKSTNLL